MGKNKSVTLKIDINSFETVLNENAGKSVAIKTTGEKLFVQAETYSALTFPNAQVRSGRCTKNADRSLMR